MRRIRSNCQQSLKGLVSAGSNPDVETVKVQTDNYAQVDDHHFEQFNVKASAQQVQAAAGAETAVQTGNAKKLVAHQVAQKTPKNATTVKRRKDKNPAKLNVLRGSPEDFGSLRSSQVPEAGVETSAYGQGFKALFETGGHPGGQFGSNSDSVGGLKQQALTSLQLALRDICRMKSLSDSPADSVAASRALAFVDRAIAEFGVDK